MYCRTRNIAIYQYIVSALFAAIVQEEKLHAKLPNHCMVHTANNFRRLLLVMVSLFFENCYMGDAGKYKIAKNKIEMNTHAQSIQAMPLC